VTREVRITDYACADDTDLRSLSADIGPGKIVTPVKTINPVTSTLTLIFLET